MSALLLGADPPAGDSAEETLFAAIADNILSKGYSVQPNALPADLALALWQHLQRMPALQFERAGVGRQSDHALNDFVRKDAVCWIVGDSVAGRQWLAFSARLQNYLNRRLLLGLFSFESHFSHYRPGDFYKVHRDAFVGEANRRLSLVAYFNPEWLHGDGGQLVIYPNEDKRDPVYVVPSFGCLVLFLSEDFPHEVLPATRDRYSIAGWYRVNGSTADRVDPPQ